MKSKPLAIGRMRGVLLRWFASNARSYPWRKTKNSWRVLVAEMMLQRTRADQVEPVFKEFIKLYPSPSALSIATDRQLLAVLAPLGLNWRLGNFKAIGKAVAEDFGGRVPNTREELKQLPGVGDYVAGAVLSIAFGQREWIVDSNVVRVYRRYYGIETSKEGRRDRPVIAISKQYVECERPKDANLALLDFAAVVCLPRSPDCEVCPLKRRCVYYSLNQ